MRVLVVTNMYPSATDPSAGCFVAEQVEDLRAAGVDVDVISFDGRRDKLNYLRAIRRVRRAVSRSSYALVHAHYGLTGAIAMLQRRAPVVTTFHGSDVGYVRWQARISWLVARRTTPVFVSRLNARMLGLPDADVVPVGIDPEHFAIHSRTHARAALGWEPDAQYILLPGSRSKAVKNAELFDATMEIVTSRIPDARPVSLEGFTREQVVHVLNAVDVVLMTSLSEGSPVTVKEALACGTPVVSVDVGDVRETIAGLPGCAICPRDPGALADAVVRALDSDDRAPLRDRGRRSSRARAVRSILDVYATASS